MNRLALRLTLAAALAGALPASAGQYETFDYHIQQMIAQSAAADATGVQTFREQLDNLRRPESGDAAQARPLYQQGLEHLNHDRLKEALAAFRQAFIADPADPEIAGQLGLTYLRLRRLKEAERLLVYALALAPAQSAPWLHLGQVYGQIGDASRAAGALANAYRFAQDRPGLVEQLRQLATTDPADAVRIGALQALKATQPTTAAKSTTATDPSTPPASVPAPPSSATPTTPATGPATGPTAAPPARSGVLLDSLRRSLASLAKPTDTATPATGSPPIPAVAGDNPGQRIYRDSIPRTCLIVTFNNGKTATLGSGLLVSADGQVITNNHVIENAENLVVKCGKRESVARIGKRSKEPDLALLTTSLNNAESFVLDATYSQGLIGLEVFVIGNPYGLEGTFSTGVISGLREIDGVRYIQISAPISPGNSGGPVILRDGSVIGITTMGLKKGQNLNFAIAAAEVIRSGLLDPSQVKIRPPRGKGE
jgi:S1-C subfamily serine protease